MDMGTMDTGRGEGLSPGQEGCRAPAQSRIAPASAPLAALALGPVPAPTKERRRSWLVGRFALLSLVTHGLLLGLPWPQSAPPDPPAPLAEEPLPPPMDVVTLPALDSPQEESVPLDSLGTIPEAAAPSPANNSLTSPAPATPRLSSRPPIGATPTPSPAPTDSPPPVDSPANSSSPADSLPPGPRPLGERLQDAQGYTFNSGARVGSPRGRSSALDLVTWQGEVAGALIDSTQPTLLPVDLVVPHALRCTVTLTPPPQPGLLAVILDRTGQVSHGPAVIYSSQYDLLDEQAIALALEQVVPNLEPPGPDFTHRLYPIAFTVSTGRDGCP